MEKPYCFSTAHSPVPHYSFLCFFSAEGLTSEKSEWTYGRTRAVWSVCHHLARLPLPAAGIHEIGGCSAHALHAVMPGFLQHHLCQGQMGANKFPSSEKTPSVTINKSPSRNAIANPSHYHTSGFINFLDCNLLNNLTFSITLSSWVSLPYYSLIFWKHRSEIMRTFMESLLDAKQCSKHATCTNLFNHHYSFPVWASFIPIKQISNSLVGHLRTWPQQ